MTRTAMAKEIELCDFSVKEIHSKKLYKLVAGGGVLTLDSSFCELTGSENIAKPLLEIKKGHKEEYVFIKTFGFVGRFTYSGETFDITYRFGTALLNRMIAKVNDFDVKTLNLDKHNAAEKKPNDSLAMLILYMNFILKLEKLSILGVPKAYQRIEHHADKLKGRIDVNAFIRKDIPFRGKISSVSYEQKYVQEILDVLYGAMVLVEKRFPALVQERLWGIRNLIYHHANKRFVDQKTLDDARQHPSIQNALYSEFKSIIEIAGYIIKYNHTQEYKLRANSKGLIFDVSILWEHYLYTLLKEHIDSNLWRVKHEEPIEVYREQFYKRRMYPDIVIKNEKEKKIIVLDAKSKSMKFAKGIGDGQAGDLDRNDFFQINTYMAYYSKQGYEVIAGGLLYPIEAEYDESKCHSSHWFGNSNTQFIVDGIDLSNIESKTTVEEIVESEKVFIERIGGLINQI